MKTTASKTLSFPDYGVTAADLIAKLIDVPENAKLRFSKIPPDRPTDPEWITITASWEEKE